MAEGNPIEKYGNTSVEREEKVVYMEMPLWALLYSL